MNDAMTEKYVNFVKNSQRYLENLVTEGHYDSCHRTEEYDADQCYQDCQEQENGDFAKTCREGGGLYKCCIR